MPAFDIDFAQLATDTGQSEDDLRWLIRQICPRGFGANLQASATPLALAADGASVMGVVSSYIGYASLSPRNSQYLPIAGCHIEFDTTAPNETLTLTMGTSSLSQAFDPSGTVRLQTVGAVYEYLRDQVINRASV